MHNNRRECIAGAIVLINTSLKYENPDEFARGIERPSFKMEKVGQDTVGVFGRIPLRNEPADPNDQPEALALILVDYDGTSPARLVSESAGVSLPDNIQYENFIGRICNLYETRFSEG